MATAPIVETLHFQAETKQLLGLMIHSLYTQRDIFLRELISNASDALDRLRFEALTNSDLVPSDRRYEIRIKPDAAARTLTISDTGVGMSRQEVIGHIGTIARSGTSELRKKMQESRSASAFAESIGQFGVGFYSAFMVADKVTLITRRMGEPAVCWESNGDGTYTLTEVEKPQCGTDIILHLQAPDPENGIEDYTDRWKLSLIVHKYSEFIAYPIIYEGPSQEPDGEDCNGENSKETKIEKTLNSVKPIWSRSRAEVSEADYNDFYKRVSIDSTAPLKVLPLKAEGTVEYQALLFIPSQAPHDLFYHAAEAGLRLYAKRVMVLDKCEDLLPRYLRFIRGVVDSTDLPLNISRQRLQQDRHISQIRKWLTRKVLDALAEIKDKEPPKYLSFWNSFGRALKEGVSADFDNREHLLPLLLFESSHSPSGLTTLKSYVERMPSDQSEILYLTGASRKVIENSPHLEGPRQRRYEILYLSDPVDELLVQSVHEFEQKKLKSVTKGKMSLGTDEEKEQRQEELKKKEEEYAQFLEACQKHLDQHLKRVRLSSRLVGSPACLVTEEHEYSPNLERLLQKGKGGGPKQRRIMELNGSHPLIERLYERFQSDPKDSAVNAAMEILFELSLLAEGSQVADPVRLNELTLAMLQRTA